MVPDQCVRSRGYIWLSVGLVCMNDQVFVLIGGGWC